MLKALVVSGILITGLLLITLPVIAQTSTGVTESATLEPGTSEPTIASQSCVVLLHGLSRTSRAMKPMARAFQKAGYKVVNVDYPSRHHPIEVLAPLAVEKLGASQCAQQRVVHFVTHSLGGILVRYYLSGNSILNLDVW